MEDLTGYLDSPFFKKQPYVLPADRYMGENEHISFSKHYRFIDMFPHRHDFIEMVYAYKSSFIQFINGERIVMEEGDLCVLDTNVTHTIEKANRDTYIVNILMRKSFFNDHILAMLSQNPLISRFLLSAIYQPEIGGKYLMFRTQNNDHVRRCITTAMCEKLDPKIASNTVIACQIVLLFSELIRLSETDITLSEMQSDVFEVVQYIENHYQNLSLQEVAKRFHYHPNYLSRLLKKQTGKTYNELIQDIRMRKVELLLKHTELQVERIAEETGFSNQYHFYRQFKKAYDMTPAMYRKLYQRKQD